MQIYRLFSVNIIKSALFVLKCDLYASPIPLHSTSHSPVLYPDSQNPRQLNSQGAAKISLNFPVFFRVDKNKIQSRFSVLLRTRTTQIHSRPKENCWEDPSHVKADRLQCRKCHFLHACKLKIHPAPLHHV